ncbi:MAG TPA: WecB/TagA/CpsF family glycosyltransferase [Chloroflexota bacterium]|nr:WecB/TagA/CpsF family glycosyltransferase [Chloroflexota bacterium]
MHALAAGDAPATDRIRVLGIRIDSLRLPDLLAHVRSTIEQGRRLTVLYVNVHCLNVARHDPAYARILSTADLVYCDGTGVQLAARLLGTPLPARMTGADWIWDLAALCAQQDFSLFLLGGGEGAAAEAASRLQHRYPQLRIVGTAAGYRVGAETLAAITQARPDILLVGMGTPRQERWIAAHRAELQVPVVWAVGALFEFVAGRIRRGPRLLTDHGLEWLCRLLIEPTKLWRRYLLGNPAFAWALFRDWRERRREGR